MCGQVTQCPFCNSLIQQLSLLIDSKLSALQPSRLPNIVDPIRKHGIPVKRKITDAERKLILQHHASGWKNDSKEGLAKKMGVSVHQVSSVTAWTKPKLKSKLTSKVLDYIIS